MKFLDESVDSEHVMLVNMIYHPPKKENDKIDCLDVIYKDVRTGKKFLKSIETPDIDIYFVKDKYQNYTYNKSFIELDKCEKHTCPYKSLPWYIAKQAGEEYVNELKRLNELGNFKEMAKIHTYPYVFGSDIPIETFYRIQWLKEYDNEAIKPLTKSYMDIEVDTISVPGFVRDGSCPINAVTVIDDITNSVYTCLLNNQNNPQIRDFVSNVDDFIDDLHESFDSSYGKLTYNIYMYDDEKELIKDVFRLINTLKRDYCLIWNGLGYDIPYILARMSRLNLDPLDIICSKEFKYKTCVLHEDTNTFQIANKGSYFRVSSFTKYIDQMILYAATRKGQKELRSNKLNSIAKDELGDTKLDYSDEANIKTLPYENYRKFVKYNIKDTLLQMGIERKANDIDNLYLRSYLNGVDQDKVFKQTVLLRSRAYYEYLLQGNILGNNVNVFSTDAGDGFVGALVGDPELNSDNGIKLFGILSMYVFDNVIDMDFAAMYPHIIIAHNIERNTMIAKLIIPEFTEDRYDHFFVSKTENDIKNDDDNDIGDDEMKEFSIGYDSGKDFMDNLLTKDYLSVGTKWFNLPDIEDVHKQFIKKFNIKPKKKFNMTNVVKWFADVLEINIE